MAARKEKHEPADTQEPPEPEVTEVEKTAEELMVEQAAEIAGVDVQTFARDAVMDAAKRTIEGAGAPPPSLTGPPVKMTHPDCRQLGVAGFNYKADEHGIFLVAPAHVPILTNAGFVRA